MTVALVLFTRDLRVHDNPVLHSAARSANHIVPLFVLDECILASGYNRPNRARFLAESLADLHTSLRGLGAALVLRRGEVAVEVARLAEVPVGEAAAPGAAAATGGIDVAVSGAARGGPPPSRHLRRVYVSRAAARR